LTAAKQYADIVKGPVPHHKRTAGGWTDVVPPNASIDQNNPNQVISTLPSGAPTKFCRLSVTQGPSTNK
jgi:hypothetical protein